MNRLVRRIAPFAMSLVLAPLAAAHAAEPLVGTWRTIDGQTNQPSSLVAISKQADVYGGKIVQILEPGAQTKCVACPGNLEDAPVVGLIIVSNVKAAGDGKFDGGRILDPRTGKSYDVQITVTDGGQKLKVLGYVGVPALGRSVTWERVAP